MQLSDNVGWCGLECPKCHCKRLDVYYIRNRGGGRVRVRICQLCGRRISTLELPLGISRNAAELAENEAKKSIVTPVERRGCFRG